MRNDRQCIDEARADLAASARLARQIIRTREHRHSDRPTHPDGYHVFLDQFADTHARVEPLAGEVDQAIIEHDIQLYVRIRLQE
jgi:hypothetical protein